MNRTRILLLGVFAVIIAAVCIRLGFWQLERLEERRAENMRVAAGLRGAPIPLETIGADSTQSRAQRVVVRGTYDYAHEVALINRSRDGAPGVNILTPLRIPGRDTAVMVNRGWVYSPDGSTIDLSRWHEADTAAGTAYVSWLHVAAPTDSVVSASPSSSSSSSPRRVMRLERAALARQIPYPIAPYQLVLIDEAAEQAAGATGYGSATPSPFGTAVVDSTRPIRIPLPALDEGAHKSYAIQWFSFAAIALIGTGALLWKESSRDGAAPL